MTAPFVELGFHPTDLRPQDLPRAGAFLGSPAEALEAALVVARVQMVDQVKKEVRGLQDPTHAQLLRIADLAWQTVFWRYRKVSAPIIADAYFRAYQAANAGDVPMTVIYDLADKHAEKVGGYFHTTSRAALADGFNTLVNRRVPAKAAANQVLDAYGLTPRQMRAFTSAKQFQTPVSDVMPRSIKARARTYVDRAFTTRIRKLSRQEEHNIDEQAKQFAWMWMQDKGRLSQKAQKLWITAKDERVCKVCGPLHGKKVGVNERFKTAQGEFWSPGLHPNCRCVVRLLENRFTKSLAGTALAEFNEEHPRAPDGRFGYKSSGIAPRYSRLKTIDVDEEFSRITAPSPRSAVARTTDQDLERMFAEVVSTGIRPQTVARHAPVQTKRPAPQTTRAQATVARPQAVLARPQAVVRRPQAKVQAPKAKLAPVQAPARPKLKPSTEVTTQVGTAKPKAPSTTGTRVYTVVTPEVLDTGPGGRSENVVRLSPGMKYTTKAHAEDIASKKAEKSIKDAVKDIMASQGGVFTVFQDRHQLNEDQVREVVEYWAHGVHQGNPLLRAADPESSAAPVATPMIESTVLDVSGVPLLTETGQTVKNRWSPDYLAQRLHLDRWDFDFRIVGVDARDLDKSHPENIFRDPKDPKTAVFDDVFWAPNEQISFSDRDYEAMILEARRFQKPKKRD
jgi:hypothetical protein